MKLLVPVIYLTYIYEWQEDHPGNIQTNYSNFIETTIHKVGEHFANPCY